LNKKPAAFTKSIAASTASLWLKSLRLKSKQATFGEYFHIRHPLPIWKTAACSSTAEPQRGAIHDETRFCSYNI